MRSKITLDHSEVQHVIAAHLKAETGFDVMPEEVAFFSAEETDNPHPSTEIEVSVSATAR